MPLAAGLYGIWELTFHNNFLTIVLASKRIFPNGLECTEEQLEESLDALSTFIEDIRQTCELNSVQEGKVNFDINVIGALPRKSVPLPVHISASLSLVTSIKGGGIFRLDNVFDVVGAIVKGFARPNTRFLDEFHQEVMDSAITLLSKAVLLLIMVQSGDWLEIDLEIDLFILLNALNDEEKENLRMYLIEKRKREEMPGIMYIDAIDANIIEEFSRILKKSQSVLSCFRNFFFKSSSSIRLSWEKKEKGGVASLLKFYKHLLFSSDSQIQLQSIQLEYPKSFHNPILASRRDLNYRRI